MSKSACLKKGYRYGKENKFRDYRMVGLSVKAVVSAVPVAAVYVMAYLFLSSLSGAVTGLLLEKLTNAVLLKEQVYIVYIVVYVSFLCCCSWQASRMRLR